MSEPKRYAMTWLTDEDAGIYVISPTEQPKGNWVNYADYANFKAENEELHKDYEALADEHTKLIDRNARLKAEVEETKDALLKHSTENHRLQVERQRLIKAGDAILNGWQSNSGSDVERFTKACWLWITAKEGKPSV